MTEIYAHHVKYGTGSFEEIPPSYKVMNQRWKEREDGGYPTVIAELNNTVAGFGYAGVYKPRSAYRFTVEDSVYVSSDAIGLGVGRLVLQALISICTKKEFRQMIAVIGDSTNKASIGLHASCGFTHIGTAKGLGYKHGKWLDIVYMQRSLM